MGTYLSLQLKDTTEKNIKGINSILRDLGYKGKTLNGVYFGAFRTREMTEEDARFMNETEEGRQQVPNIERPITPEILKKMFFSWFDEGTTEYKLSNFSGDTEKETQDNAKNIHILALFIQSQPAVFDLKKCINYDLETVMSYVEDYLQPEPDKQLEMF